MLECQRNRSINYLFAMLGIWLLVSAGAQAAPHRGLSVTIHEQDKATSEQLYTASYALVIGNDQYDDDAWVDLSNAVYDAQAVAKELQSRGFEVTLLENLTSNEMKAELEKFVIFKGRDKNARLFIWYAGHGHTVDGEGYLVPSDAPDPAIEDGVDFRYKALSLRRFGEFMRQARARHVLAVFDSCFSGTVFSTARSKPPAVVGRAVTLKVRQFVSSGDARQTVSDDGLFRKLFLDAISGRDPRADANGDGYILGTELGLFLHQRMSNLTENKQIPRSGKINAYQLDLGDFVFQTKVALKPNLTTTPETNIEPAVQPSPQVIVTKPETSKPMQLEATKPEALPKQAHKGMSNQEAIDLGNAERKERLKAYNAEVMECDHLAAHAQDADAVADGVPYSKLQEGFVINACTNALQSHPSVRRFHTQLARGYVKAGQHTKAVAHLQKAVDLGSAQAMAYMGILHRIGKGVPQNLMESRRWLVRSADNGNLAGMVIAASYFRDGVGGPKDPYRALTLYEKAVQQSKEEVSEALYALAVMYDKGEGIGQNTAMSASYMVRAFNSGSSDAKTALMTKAENISRGTRWNIQKRLASSGCYDGKIDGSFGPQTRAALEACKNSKSTLAR